MKMLTKWQIVNECICIYFEWCPDTVSVYKVWYQLHCIISVAGGGGIGCCCQSDPIVASVEYRVESLKEALAQNEVQSGSTVGADVDNNQINAAGNSTNVTVEITRPDLSVSG